jgi:hypothetical protein
VICDVHLYALGDSGDREVTFCEVCDAWVCAECKPKLIRRLKAAINRKKFVVVRQSSEDMKEVTVECLHCHGSVVIQYTPKANGMFVVVRPCSVCLADSDIMDHIDAFKKKLKE